MIDLKLVNMLIEIVKEKNILVYKYIVEGGGIDGVVL